MLRARVWLGLVASAAFLLLLLSQVDRAELVDALAEAQPGWLLAAFGVYLLALWWRALRWRLVLGAAVPLGSADACALVVIGYAANNVLPARAGELVRAQLLHDRYGGGRLTALGTIAVERVADGLVLALMLAATVAIAGGNATLNALALAASALFIALAALLVTFAGGAARAPADATQVEARAWRLLRLAPSRLRPRAAAWLASFLRGLGAVRGARAWAAVLAATTLSWSLEAAMYWLVGLSFGLELHPALYLGVCGAANLAVAIPATTGGIGPFEYFAREAVVRFGAGSALGTAYALTLHALLLVPVVLIGVALLWWRHVAPRALLRAARAAELRACE